MRTPRELPKDTQQLIDDFLTGDLPAWQRERATAIRLMALGYRNMQVAEIVGRHANTVSVWRKEFVDRGIESISAPRGGRRNQLMDEDSERAFVKGFERAAESGELVTVRAVHEALEKQTGKKVWPATVYRMLERHGWRKIAPRLAHPGADPTRREAFKQTSRATLQPPLDLTLAR